MNQTDLEGYLIVLKTYDASDNPHKGYYGVDRIPSYPSTYPAEATAMNDYVFGDYKAAETNLIPNFEKAFKLWKTFIGSPREFEILFCRITEGAQSSTSALGNMELLGFDVAGISGDAWSIVADMPTSSWSKKYKLSINKNGLFNNENIARSYLQDYQDYKEADWDCGLDVVFVARVPVPVQRNPS